MQLTENFNISEFHCKGAKCGCEHSLHDPVLSAYLQQIRTRFGKPLRITSGYRCETHNKAVGGVSGSLHTKGMAADIVISGVNPLEIAEYAEQIGIKGIGLYGPEDGNFVHIDTRKTKSFWYGHKQEKRDTFMANKSYQGVYLITCRIGNLDTVHTLIFDRSVGDQFQSIPGHPCGVRMIAETASFTPENIGNDTVQIINAIELGI